MGKPRTPRNVAQATELLDHYAELSHAAAHVEATRNAELARINAAADAERGPLLEELEQIRTALQPWWLKAGAELVKGKKSVELGGCMIGSRTGNKKLAHKYPDDEQAIAALRVARMFASTTRTTVSLDKSAIVRFLGLPSSATARKLAELGFTIDQAELFYVEPVKQDATIG